MKEATRMEVQPTNTPSDVPNGSAAQKHPGRRTLLSVAAALGVFGGIAALGFGLVCAIAHDLVPDDPVLSPLSTGLLILGIPMMLAGSVLLDKIDEKK